MSHRKQMITKRLIKYVVSLIPEEVIMELFFFLVLLFSCCYKLLLLAKQSVRSSDPLSFILHRTACSPFSKNL